MIATTATYFRIQDDISNAVVSALKVSLAALAPLHGGDTSNKVAYAALLGGRSSTIRLAERQTPIRQ